jgi:hypothetical protein
MKLSAWVEQSAANLGITPRALWVRMYRGRQPWPDLERKNKRVIEVLAPPLCPSCVPSGVMPKARGSASPTSLEAPSISRTSTPEATA